MTQQQSNILSSPFPGLRPFKTEETHLFFGREGQIDEVLSKMSKHRFVAVLGTSGSGKSSFMYCGLIPSLHGGFMTEAGANWRVVVTRPGLSPIDNLSKSVTRSEIPESEEEQFQLRHNLNQAVLRSSALGLAELIKQVRRSPDEQVLVLVDQFEELFRFSQSNDSDQANETLAFVKLLSEAVAQRQVPIYVVMTMRSDYIGDCAEFPDFTRMINDSHYLIPQMTRDQKRQAVLGPVAVGGGQMSSRLVQQLLNDLGSNPDQLPILQHALMRTWNYWTTHESQSEDIDLYHYEAIGGMAEALSMHANEAYEELSTEEQLLCERIFKCLTEKGSDGRGIRRPTRIRDIAAITEEPEEKIIAVINRFRRPGRTLLMPNMAIEADSDTVVDISHESLMRIWDRLREWVQEESESVKIYLRLAEAAAMFQLGTSSLWRPPDLQVAIAWQEKENPNKAWGLRYHPTYERTMNFLENSKQAYEEEQRGKEKMQKKRLQRTRLVALALGLAVIVSSFFLVYAQLQTQKAKENEAIAEEQKKKALDNQKEADQQRELAENKALEAQREKQRAEEEATEAEKQRQLAEKASFRAQQARLEAESSALEADSARQVAEESAEEAAKQRRLSDQNANIAEKERVRAEEEREAAQQLRFKAISQTMAVKSLQLDDSAQQGLVAQQAFLFNKKYNKNELDPDIYNGLYYARKTLEGSQFNAFKGEPHQDVIEKMQFGEKGELFTAGHDGMLKRWDASTRQGSELLQLNKVFRAMAVGRDSKGNQCFAVGTEGGELILGLSNDPLQRERYKTHQGSVWGIRALKQQQGAVSFGADGRVAFQTWDGGQSFTICQSEDRATEVVEMPGRNALIALLESGALVRWELKEDSPTDTLIVGLPKQSQTFALSPNGSEAAIGLGSGKVAIWNLEQGQLRQQLTGHSALISDLQYSSDGKWICSASFDGRVLLWDRKNLLSPKAVFNDHQGWVWSVAFTPDQKNLITASGKGKLKVYPLSAEGHAQAVSDRLDREFSPEEWEQFVGKDIPYPYGQEE